MGKGSEKDSYELVISKSFKVVLFLFSFFKCQMMQLFPSLSVISFFSISYFNVSSNYCCCSKIISQVPNIQFPMKVTLTLSFLVLGMALILKFWSLPEYALAHCVSIYKSWLSTFPSLLKLSNGHMYSTNIIQHSKYIGIQESRNIMDQKLYNPGYKFSERKCLFLLILCILAQCLKPRGVQ